MPGLTDEILAAARLAHTTGMRVRVVIERGPGAAAHIREAALAADAAVTVELTPTSVIGYFGTARRANRAQPVRSAERERGDRVTRSLA